MMPRLKEIYQKEELVIFLNFFVQNIQILLYPR